MILVCWMKKKGGKKKKKGLVPKCYCETEKEERRESRTVAIKKKGSPMRPALRPGRKSGDRQSKRPLSFLNLGIDCLSY